jgi:hypothetical protein
VRLPAVPRWIGPVLVAAFLLLTGWAAYSVSALTAAAQAPGPSGPTLSYDGTGSYGYVASLDPNTLFNSTTVSGTNITLFVSITKWVNVTFVSTVALGFGSGESLNDQFSTSLSTAAWSRSLGSTVHEVGSDNTTNLTVTDRFALNVSRVESLVNTIDSQLNYTATSFTVSFVASVSGSVVLGSEAAPVTLDSWLNLTFRGPLIVPTGDPAGVSGSLAGPDSPGGSGGGAALTIAWLELVGAVGALVASAWLLWASRVGAAPATLPDLERLTEPYEEVIARTSQPPEGGKVLPVDRWEDLVKVADTLGRPILRPVAGPGNPEGSDFYVFDGTLAYLYRYPRSKDATATVGRPRPRAGGGPEPAASVPRPPVASPRPPVSPSTSMARPPGGASVPPKSLTDQLDAELARIRVAPIDPATRQYLRQRHAIAARIVLSSGPHEGRRAVDELRLTIDRTISGSSPRA